MDGEAVQPAGGRIKGRIEVAARVSGRRASIIENNLTMLRDAFGSGGLVKAAMERHEITSDLLRAWWRQAMSGKLAGTPRPALFGPVANEATCFAKVRVVEDAPPPPASTSPACAGPPDRIAIELLSGVRISVDLVGADALGRVLAVLPR